MAPDQSIYISQSDVRKMFGVTGTTLWRWVHEKTWLGFPKPAMKLPSKPGSKNPLAGRVFYKRADIEEFQKRMRA